MSLLLWKRGSKVAEAVADRVCQSVTHALLRSAICIHTRYVEQLRICGDGVPLRNALQEARLDRDIRARLAEQQKASEKRIARMESSPWSLRRTPSRVDPTATYNHLLDQQFSHRIPAVDIDDQFFPLHVPSVTRPWS